jgi:hypothetical protein
MLLITVSLYHVQEMYCATWSCVTGRGLLDLIRERFGLIGGFTIAVILIANGAIVSEFGGIGAATEMWNEQRFYNPQRHAYIFYLSCGAIGAWKDILLSDARFLLTPLRPLWCILVGET